MSLFRFLIISMVYFLFFMSTFLTRAQNQMRTVIAEWNSNERIINEKNQAKKRTRISRPDGGIITLYFSVVEIELHRRQLPHSGRLVFTLRSIHSPTLNSDEHLFVSFYVLFFLLVVFRFIGTSHFIRIRNRLLFLCACVLYVRLYSYW